jgi:GINS complex subunit 1
MVLELKRSPEWLPNFDEEGVRLVFEECKKLDEMIQELSLKLDSQQDEDEVDAMYTRKVKFTIQTLHLCICRNKRLLLAYFHARNEKIELFFWETNSPVMPNEFAQKLSREEVEYYNRYQLIVSNTMEKMDLDLLSHRIPPGSNLFVQVRVVQECGEVMLQSGVRVVLTRNSTHYLRRDDVEHLIRQNVLEEIIDKL